MNQIEQLNQWIRESNRIVFFGGAGVSTESHIPDFRSDNGLYKKKYPYPAETMLSHTFFVNHPKEFFDFYFNQMIYEDAVPNKAHYALSKLEQAGKLKAIVTQNIDGLHQKQGLSTCSSFMVRFFAIIALGAENSLRWKRRLSFVIKMAFLAVMWMGRS